METKETEILDPFETRATRLLVKVFRRMHHAPKLHKHYVGLCQEYWECSALPMSTFDGDELTRLVVAAHDECVRVEIRQGRPGRIKITLSPRTRHGDLYHRHPTIENAIAELRQRWG